MNGAAFICISDYEGWHGRHEKHNITLSSSAGEKKPSDPGSWSWEPFMNRILWGIWHF